MNQLDSPKSSNPQPLAHLGGIAFVFATNDQSSSALTSSVCTAWT
ncbi:hypothetical protein AVDCRST_MAG92-595 [uncultured Coleofasciculus sp.]|uniref:Uncharacterized protein n=1 Tax=uncultured Coleofasciculus sp. TaxID=1267456 RepID=A0A6J4HDL4_9CYAN|nr:hypothetical protein AVDCRST_MAG92-595 [uncultured Coleofasciculus sp.]